MSTYKRWTSKEEDILYKWISRYPYNLSTAFDITAKEINRTPHSCKFHWYNYLSRKTDNIAFMTISNKVAIKNRKSLSLNISRETIQEKTRRITIPSIYIRLKELFKK